jgi:hypothetical protein
MRPLQLAWVAPFCLILVALVPVAGATAPVHGTVTTCKATSLCLFKFNTTAGTGWANTTNGKMSFQLPGEAKASYNLSYSTYIGSLIGTYTYWTVGNFYGTDVNTGWVVYGTTDTNFTITAHCSRGCYYTYTTDNGTIVFHFTHQELTSTSVSCNPSSIDVASKTNCTVTVTDLWNASHIPTGKVWFFSAGVGTFSNHHTCNLSAGQCSITWHPSDDTGGTVTISVIYGGVASAFYKTTGSTHVVVTGGG